jgi:hypothetical protein
VLEGLRFVTFVFLRSVTANGGWLLAWPLVCKAYGDFNHHGADGSGQGTWLIGKDTVIKSMMAPRPEECPLSPPTKWAAEMEPCVAGGGAAALREDSRQWGPSGQRSACALSTCHKG